TNDRTQLQISPEDRRSSRGLDPAGVSKDTTHMSIIDKDGNIFDVTPSGGWINGAVILGDTGIGMSVRGEQFWLDPTRAAQIRPRSRPRYTLTPSLVLKGDVRMRNRSDDRSDYAQSLRWRRPAPRLLRDRVLVSGMRIIDIHPHVISTDETRYPRAPIGGHQSDWSRERPVPYEKMIAAMDTAGIAKSALVQAS